MLLLLDRMQGRLEVLEEFLLFGAFVDGRSEGQDDESRPTAISSNPSTFSDTHQLLSPSASMARTHKGGGPPRRSSNGSGAAASTAASSSRRSDAQRSSPTNQSPSPPPDQGRHRIILDADMIRALVGGVETSRGRDPKTELEHVGFKCAFLRLLKPSLLSSS